MSLQGNKLDLNKLLRSYEGREIPEDMQAWFTLARQAKNIQRDLDEVENQIRDVQNTMKHLLLQKQKLGSIEKHFLENMDKVLPQGGESSWANLA